MSKEFKNIDELFKTTVGLGTAKAPASVKPNVLAAIGGLKWWAFGAALLLITAVGAVIMTINMAPNDAFAQYVPQEPTEYLRIEKYEQTKHETNLLKAASVEREVNSKIPNTVAEKTQSPKTIVHHQNVNLNNNRTVIKTNHTSLKAPTKKDKKSDELAIFATAKTKNENESVLASSPSNSKVASKNMSLPVVFPDDKKAVENLIKTKAQSQEIVRTDSILKTRIAIISAENEQTENTSIITPESKDSVVKPVRIERLNNDSLFADIKIETDPENKKGFWMIGAKIGPSINIVDYTDSEFSTSLSKFHSEKLGYHGHVYGQYNFPSKITTTAGIGLENQSFNTTFLTTNTSLEINSNSVFSHYIYQDTSNIIIDSVYITEYDTTETIELQNHYGLTRNQYLQIPIKIGYQVERNKWIFGVDLSAQLNFLLKTSGLYYENNSVLDLSGSQIFKRTTFSYSAGANIQYNVFNNLYLVSEVRYSPAIQNYYEKSYAKRSINAVQLGFGIGLKL